MRHRLSSYTERSRRVSRAAMLAALLLAFAACLRVQAQQGGSLADAARQARAQRQPQSQPDTGKAQQVINELMEDQSDSDAPGGFKTYNAGDYKVWVPAPYRVQGHDDAGVVLSGPVLGSKHPIVLVGTPIVARWGNNEEAFQDAANQFARLYAQSANCTKTKVADHGAYECSMAAATLLGERVTGNAVFVRSAGNVYPLFCMTPSESRARDTLNNKRVDRSTREWATENLGREDDDMKAVWQKCETFFGSIHFKLTVAGQAETTPVSQSGPAKAATPKPPNGAGAAVSAGQVHPATAVAGTAVAAAQPPPPPAATGTAPPVNPESPSTVPPGFKVQPFTYCKSANDCWNASIVVPADAQLLSSDCKQFVFQTKVQGAPFLLMAGSAGADGCGRRTQSDANLVRWNELAQPESARAPGTYNTISTLQANLDGRPATITQIGFRKGLTEWRGKRAEFESNGVPLVVGCMSPKESFAGGDEICSGLIASLRLQ